ncbi:MAG: hypothetical protein ABL916_09500 [Burkholderiaceae bacterium]
MNPNNRGADTCRATLVRWVGGTLCVAALLTACGGGSDADAGGGAPEAGFSVSVAPASLTVGQGQDAVIEVSVQRRTGFSDSVTVTLSQPPAGVTAGQLVLPAGTSRGVLPIHIGAELAPGATLRLELVASAAGVSHGGSSTLTVGAPQPDAQAAIAAALRSGEIDAPNALLYRAYALLGDRRLPAAYRGAGSVEEDNALFDEIRTRFAGLPAALQDALRPFIVRPADPRSVWNATGATGIGRVQALRERRAALSATSCAASAAGTWISKRSTNHPVRVWAQCLGEAGFDAESISVIDRTLFVLDRVHARMTGVMGQALPDLEGDDNAIDFYVVNDGGYVYRQDGNFRPKGLGTTYWSEPQTPLGKGGSGFVTLPRSLLYTSRFHNTVIHEFFHVLQKARNADFSPRAKAGNPDEGENHWFIEASAAWASAHFDRTLAPWPDGRGAYEDAHRRFKQYFLPSFDALNATGSPHDYSAYIWPHFVEQETGGTAFMTNIWVGLEAVSSFEAADQAIDRAYPFATNFKRFALRNLNMPFLPGDPLPREKRHVKLDEDQFADDGKPPPIDAATLTANSDFSRNFELKNLSASYLRLNISQEGAATRKVTVDTSTLKPADGLVVQALVKTTDGWLAEPIDVGPDKLVFCFDKGPTTATARGSFSEILFIVSNHALTSAGDITGSLKVQPKSTPCAEVWEGTIEQVVRFESDLAISTFTSHASVVFEFDDTADAQAGEVPYRLKSGTWTWDVLHNLFGRNPPCRTAITGSGAMPLGTYQPLVPSGSAGNLSIFPETLQFGGSGLSVVGVTQVSNCNDSLTDVTTFDPMYTLFWWNAGGVGVTSADGRSLRSQGSAPGGVTYDIRLDKKMGAD